MDNEQLLSNHHYLFILCIYNDTLQLFEQLYKLP